MYGCGNDCLILIPFRLPQISSLTLSLKCFFSDSDLCPNVGIGPLLQIPHVPRAGPVLLTLLFFPQLFSSTKFCDYAKAFGCVDHNKLWKIVKEMVILDHLTCLLRNLYVGQEATVRTGHGKTDWFQIGKGVHEGCILSPCLFNLYAEYIMRNAGLEETQDGIKIAGRNINNLRYVDNTTLMAESEEEQKSLLIKVKEEREKVGVKLNVQKTKIMASGPITS